MTIFLIITYKTTFSNHIVEYFKSLNPMNGYQFNFLAVGLDDMNELEFIDNINKKLSDYSNLENVYVFSDVGLPTKIAKILENQNKKIKIIRSQGSLIENGFLTYMIVNTKAPERVIKKTINSAIKKD